MLRWLFLFLVALQLVLLSACFKRHHDSADYYEADSFEADGDYDHATAMPSAKPKRAPSASGRSAGASAPPMVMAEMSYDAPEPAPEPEVQPATTSAATQRMVFYNGYAQIRVAGVEDGIDAAKTTTEAAGGHVEAIGADYVVLRVPVARFGEVFDQLQGLGEVLDKQVTADDVTDSFRAVSLRLDTAKATRARLQELLAKADNEAEKLELLRQIQRLTDEIDAVEAQARTLKQLAAMSRITLSFVARDALAWQGAEADTAELSWIRSLSPFHSEVELHTRKLTLDVPEGMVALDLKRQFVAESADGARVWTHKLLNEPAGDADFWLAAVEERLGQDFATAERTTLGGLPALRLVDRSDEPYTWVIAVRPQGKHLHLVQVHYPSAEHEARHAPAIEAVLDGGEA